MVLCDAVMMGDRKAADKWDVTQRTIQRWRTSLETDDKLRHLTTQYRQQQTEKWLEDIPEAMAAFVDFFKRAARELDPKEATAADLVAAFEAVADVHLTQKIVSERLKDSEG